MNATTAQQVTHAIRCWVPSDPDFNSDEYCTVGMHLWDEDGDDFRYLDRLRKIEAMLDIGPLAGYFDPPIKNSSKN